MKKYRDIDGNSGVDAYSFDDESITVKFKNGGIYLYTYDSTGIENIEEMKELAESGDGLNAFINRYVRSRYASKLA